jgi:starch phosphorylase
VDNIPRDWIARMKTSIRKLAPVFNTNRMVKDYAEKFYLPADQRGRKLAANGMERSIALAKVKEKLRQKWGGVKVIGVHQSGNGHYRVGDNMLVEALVDLPEIDPSEVTVQLFAGPITATGQLGNGQVLKMEHSKHIANDRHMFSGRIDCRLSGRQGFAVRVLPGNADLATPFEPGLISWN